MLTIRGKTIMLKPMTATDIVANIDDIRATLTPEALATPLSAKTLPHLLRIVHAMARKQVPDVALDDIEEPLDFTNFEQVMRALTPKEPSIYIHHETGHA